MHSEASNPYQSPVTESTLHPGSSRISFSIAVAALLTTSAWLIYNVSLLGALLPGAIGVLASASYGWRVSRAVVCTVLAYIIGVSVIVLANVLLPVVYPDMMNLLADDDWIKIETRIYAGSGVLGAIAGALGGLVLHAKRFTNPELSRTSD